MLACLREGVFLSGGCARIPNIDRLASQIFGLPAAFGSASCISGLKSALDQPEFSTAIGLVRYGSYQVRKRMAEKNSIASHFKKTFTQIFKRAA